MKALTLDRTQAAAWVSRVTGYRVPLSVVRYWEQARVVRPQHPGHRRPAAYNVRDLVTLRLVAELRRDGAPLQRIRRAMKTLRARWPELDGRPGGWRMAVLASGDVVHLDGRANLFDLTRRAGQGGWCFLFAAREYIDGAKRAVAGGAR